MGFCIKLIIYEANNLVIFSSRWVPISLPVLNSRILHACILPIKNEESNSSMCESIDEISKQEIEDFKNNLKFKLTGINYETYIKQFWVGLLEGDGTISTNINTTSKSIKVRFVIALKNEINNFIMLKKIQTIVGGRVIIERKDKYVT